MTGQENYTQLIKQEALALGFMDCGVAQAKRLTDEEDRLAHWLNQGLHGKMSYMERHFDKRLDPTLLVHGAKSVISLSYTYYPKEKLAETKTPKLAKYAYGDDYHDVIREKLNTLLAILRTKIGPIEGRAFVDSAPVMERAWAQRSGLGWIGKNSLLLTRKQGSFIFLAELIVDLELDYDAAHIGNYCGSCNACMEACPTQAITAPYTVDANRCISYLTIELREAIPLELQGRLDDWVFGCDVCQDVCPWNRFAKPTDEPRFAPSEELKDLQREDWEQMDEALFDRVLGRSALRRAGVEGIRRTMDFLKLTKAEN